MPRNGRGPKKTRTQGLYDRIADVHNLAMRFNGYQPSIARYLRSIDLKINTDSLILDAGSGTGLVTLAIQDAGLGPKCIVSLDLSVKSLHVLQDELAKRRRKFDNAFAVQGNILRMPFGDETFDAVLMCGVLEYTPLDTGLAEAARVLKAGSRLVLLPVRPSLVGSFLELLYSFKTHRTEDVRDAASPYFNLIGNDRFPITEPIAWSKAILLFEKK
jgi:ubiquinone/menaquinone biosynthesis C-methylase UbiE